MDKNPLGDGRTIPIGDEGLDLATMLQSGPSVPQSSVSGEIPPMPEQQPLPGMEQMVAPPEPAPAPEAPTAKAAPAPAPDEGPDEDMMSQMVLPNEKEKAALKAAHGVLRVVPIPYTRADGKIQTYVLKQLTRSQWRTMEENARRIADAKPGVAAEEIFQEKIVAAACVWPSLPEHRIATMPPGLVPTLFGVIQQMGLFFNPEAIMSVTFTL